MEQSESITELAAALAAAQGELKAVSKTGKSNYGKFVELGAALEHVLPILSKQGLSVTQMPVIGDDNTTHMVTMLMHKSGEWIKSTYPVRMQQTTPQGQGSAITYARRYALMAVVGIAGDDDDGQAGTDGNTPETRRPAAPRTAPPAPVSKPARPVDRARITAFLRASGVQDDDMVEVLKKQYHVVEPAKMTEDEARHVLGVLEAKRTAAGEVAA